MEEAIKKVEAKKEEEIIQVKRSDIDKLVQEMIKREKDNKESEAEIISYPMAIKYYLGKKRGSMVFVDFKTSAGKQKLILIEIKDESVLIKGIYYGVPPTSIWYDAKDRARATIIEGLPTAINRDLMFNAEARSTYEQKLLLRLALKQRNEVLLTILLFIALGVILANVFVSYNLYTQVKTIRSALATLLEQKTGTK